MDSQTWEAVAKIFAIFAGVVFGSVAISSASFVWVRKQVFGYGGSALCMAGVVLLGLSIWHSVEFGVTGNGLSFKAAKDIVASAANSADEAAKAAEQAAKASVGPLANSDPVKKAQLLKASDDAKKASEEARKHLEAVTII
jgi:hypothetical protein